MKINGRKMKINKDARFNLITIACIIVAYIVLQLMTTAGMLSYLLQGLLVPLCYYSILAVSLNLTVGILGELSLGQAGFMCIGAFSSAFFSKCTVSAIPNTFIRFTLAILIGAICAGVFGIFIGMIVLRLQGDYLAIVTLAFGEIIKNVINAIYIGIDRKGIHFSLKDAASLNLLEDGMVIINGPQGITGTPQDTNFSVAALLLILSFIIVSNLINSRTGRAIMAIRDNRVAAEAMGIDVSKFRILTFSVTAALAGVAGVLYSHNISSLNATPKNFGYNMSIMILVFVVLGGIGNISGSIIAAVILTLLPEYLRFLQDYRMLMYAVVLIIMMIFNWNPTCIAVRKKYSPRNLLKKRTQEEV